MTTIGRLRKFCRRHRWLLVLVIVMAVVIPPLVRSEQIDNRQEEYVRCVSVWADDFTERFEHLAEPIARKDAAEDLIMRAAAASDREALIVALDEYVEASDALTQAREERPIPEPPRLQCNGG